jgi:membrane-bound hydrogenase subunit mbhJ
MVYWHWLRNLFSLPKTTGFPTEPDPAVEAMSQSPVTIRARGQARTPLSGSLAIRHLDAGSCNGCESELLMLSSPDYDFSRYGFSYAPSPKHADLLVVTGVITAPMVPVIRAVYDQMGTPKLVVAVGVCAISGGVFSGAPGVVGGLDDIAAVTVSVDGCPPSPGDILRGLLLAVNRSTPAGAVNPQEELA